MIKHIKRYLKRYSGPQVQCPSGNQSCDSLILGTITRRLNRYKISIESDTHTHYSIKEIRDILVDIEYCTKVIFDRTKNHAPCFPMNEFKDMISKIIQKVEGLELVVLASSRWYVDMYRIACNSRYCLCALLASRSSPVDN